MAEALARAGADIVATSAHMEESGSEVERRVLAAGRTFRGIRADLAERASVSWLASQLNGLGRPIDVLVNNAGTIARAPAAEHSDEAWDLVLAVDLSSQFILARDIGSRMLERGSGKIIFTASVLSFQGGLNVPGYTAAKSGLAGLTRALANEWASDGVNVNAIAPGYLTTDGNQTLRNDPARSQSILDRIPAQRWGDPADIGGATVFLASSASDYVHGAVLPVDGGWLGR
jgi:2-deoxy-D-gluconate 3-dehydrogenase